MYTFRKEKKENKFASHVSNLTFFPSSISRIWFFFKENSKKQSKLIKNKPLCLYYNLPESYLQIIQKNNSKSCVSSPPPHHFCHQSEHITVYGLCSRSSTSQPNRKSRESWAVSPSSASINQFTKSPPEVPLSKILSDSSWTWSHCHVEMSWKQILRQPGAS